MTGLFWAVPIEIGRDDARRQAVEELAKAKYGGTPEWMSRAAERASRIIERVLDTYLRWRAGQGGGGGVSPGFVVAVVILLLLIALVIWRVGAPKWRRRTSGGASLELDSTKPAADYRSLAAQHAEAGDFRSAVRDRFRAVVRELEVRTILDVRPARTAWEAAYRASRVIPAGADALHRGAEMFNGVVYGESVADAQAYAQMVAVDQAVTAAADSADLAADEPDPAGLGPAR